MKRTPFSLAGLVIVVPLGIAVGTVQLVVDGVITLLRKLRAYETDALADWNMALSGMAPNATIDKLIEEEDNAH